MALELRNIHFSFNGKTIFNDISARFEKSNIYAIIGPNGSGKTTLLKIILMLCKPSVGNVLYEGKNIKIFSFIDRAKVFSYLPQIPHFNSEDSLWEVAKRGDYPHKRNPPAPRSLSERKEIAEKYLELQNMWNRKMSTLSGGEIQRGIIARVIIQDTPIMILDEPLNHLDLPHRLKLFELFEKMREEGKTIIYAVHDFNFSLEYCHKIFIITKKGNLKELKGGEEDLKKILKETYNVDFKTIKSKDKFYFFPNIGKE